MFLGCRNSLRFVLSRSSFAVGSKLHDGKQNTKDFFFCLNLESNAQNVRTPLLFLFYADTIQRRCKATSMLSDR